MSAGEFVKLILGTRIKVSYECTSELIGFDLLRGFRSTVSSTRWTLPLKFRTVYATLHKFDLF